MMKFQRATLVGKIPAVEKINIRDPEEMELFLKETMNADWGSVYKISCTEQIQK